MPDHDSPLSRRTFLKAGSALLVVAAAGLPEATAADEDGPVRLQNDFLQAEFDGRGLTALHDKALKQTIPFGGDGFAVTLDQATLDSAQFPTPTRSQDKNTVTYRYALGPHAVTITYELQAGWRFVSKQVSLDTTDGADYRVKSLTPFRATLGAPVAEERLNRGGSYGAFVRFGAGGQPGFGLFLVGAEPVHAVAARGASGVGLLRAGDGLAAQLRTVPRRPGVPRTVWPDRAGLPRIGRAGA